MGRSCSACEQYEEPSPVRPPPPPLHRIPSADAMGEYEMITQTDVTSQLKAKRENMAHKKLCPHKKEGMYVSLKKPIPPPKPPVEKQKSRPNKVYSSYSFDNSKCEVHNSTKNIQEKKISRPRFKSEGHRTSLDQQDVNFDEFGDNANRKVSSVMNSTFSSRCMMSSTSSTAFPPQTRISLGSMREIKRSKVQLGRKDSGPSVSNYDYSYFENRSSGSGSIPMNSRKAPSSSWSTLIEEDKYEDVLDGDRYVFNENNGDMGFTTAEGKEGMLELSNKLWTQHSRNVQEMYSK